MNWLNWVLAIFMVVGAADRIFGGKLGLGKELENGLMLLGVMMLSMVGMIVISPLIAWLLNPLLSKMNFGIDPSIITAIFFANDMGGAPLAVEVAKDAQMGLFNGLVVAATMGATVSFTVPFALGIIPKDRQKELLVGLLCGVVTIPIGCFFGGLVAGVPFVPLILDLLPLIVVAGVVAFGLLKFPNACVKIFSWLGVGINALITFGLAVGIFEALTGVKLLPYAAPISDGMTVIANAAYALAGSFVLISIVSRLLKKPLVKLGEKIGLNEHSMLGFVATLATSTPVFGFMVKMDRRGMVLNCAFATSAAWVIGGHLAFTMAMDAAFVPAMMVAKLVGGITAVVVAALIYKRIFKGEEKLLGEVTLSDLQEIEKKVEN
jgi:ethanolamine transporter